MYKRLIAFLTPTLVACGCVWPVFGQSAATHDHQPHQQTAAVAQTEADAAVTINFPDVRVLDQNGRELNFYRDLVKGRTVAINFIFTTCTTICPPLGATFAKIQTLLGARAGKEVQLISISVDPVTDTPERLKAWGAKFGARAGWTFVTGEKQAIDQLLRALNASVTRKEDHTPVALLGHEPSGTWTRTYGLAKPTQLVAQLEAKLQLQAAQPTPAAAPATRTTAAQNYFTDVELLDQDGQTRRLYSDLLKGRTVVINAFFTTCTGICPPMNQNFARVQEALGERLGKDVLLLSFSVDPAHDTPERLKAYAEKLGAKSGWYLLSGKPANVETALRKLGQYVADKNDHLSVVLIGNERTGLWKKAHGLARAEALIAVVNSVVNDQLPTASTSRADAGKQQ